MANIVYVNEDSPASGSYAGCDTEYYSPVAKNYWLCNVFRDCCEGDEGYFVLNWNPLPVMRFDDSVKYEGAMTRNQFSTACRPNSGSGK